MLHRFTPVRTRQLHRAGVKLRPGETVEYILTDVDSNLPDDRACAFTLWEGWRGYDVNKYQEMLREAFEPFEHFALRKRAGPQLLVRRACS